MISQLKGMNTYEEIWGRTIEYKKLISYLEELA
jgi:hypothetical protein